MDVDYNFTTMGSQASVAHTSPCGWTVDDVESWARTAKLSESTISILRENEVDGPTLVTLSREELYSELGIRSLSARRYLYDLIEQLRVQHNSTDFLAAIDAHEGEIEQLKNQRGPSDVAAGGNHKNSLDGAIFTTLESDAEHQRQILNDYFLAFQTQARLNIGEATLQDSEMARDEQRRLDELALIAEFDHRYVSTLQPPGRHREQNEQPERSEIRSLFALAIETCASSRINVADAIQGAQVRIFEGGHDTLPESAVNIENFHADDELNARVALDNRPLHISACDDDIRSIAIAKRTQDQPIQLNDLPILPRCNVCYEESVRGVVFACDHPCCIDCLRALFQTVLRDSSLLPIRCCEIPVDISLASMVLGDDDYKQLSKRILACEAKRKMYCPSCSEFVNLDIHPPGIKEFECDCGEPLCAVCATKAHPDTSCAENQATQRGGENEILEIARLQGWKQCPTCQCVIEHAYGCFHMTCRCGHGFCFTCLAPWTAGRGGCINHCELWDETRLQEAADNRVVQNIGNRVVAAPERAQMIRREIHALEQNEVCQHEWVRVNHRGTCERCQYGLYVYGMRCRGVCRAMVCYTCAHHRIPSCGWR